MRASHKIACEQALRGALEAGREKEGGLATTSLEFEYMHLKSQCEMLIGGDDISNDVITLGACFHVFFNVCLIHARFRFTLIGGNLTAQLTGSHRGIGGGIQFPDSLLTPPLERHGELARWLATHFEFLSANPNPDF